SGPVSTDVSHLVGPRHTHVLAGRLACRTSQPEGRGMTRARRPVALATALATAAGLGLVIAPPLAASPPAVTILPALPVLDEDFPRRTPLVEPPADAADAALRLGLSGWHEVVRRLNDAQESSDRVSVQVVGRSTEGRDLLLVTLTAPE